MTCSVLSVVHCLLCIVCCGVVSLAFSGELLRHKPCYNASQGSSTPFRPKALGDLAAILGEYCRGWRWQRCAGEVGRYLFVGVLVPVERLQEAHQIKSFIVVANHKLWNSMGLNCRAATPRGCDVRPWQHYALASVLAIRCASSRALRLRCKATSMIRGHLCGSVFGQN